MWVGGEAEKLGIEVTRVEPRRRGETSGVELEVTGVQLKTETEGICRFVSGRT